MYSTDACTQMYIYILRLDTSDYLEQCKIDWNQS